jgi:hypothetical protein
MTTLTVGAGRAGLPFLMSPGDRRVTEEVDVERRTGLDSMPFSSGSPDMTLLTPLLAVPLRFADGFGSSVVIAT